MIKKILRWLVPFVALLVWTSVLDTIFRSFTNMDGIFIAHMYEILLWSIGSFIFVFVAYLLEPINKIRVAGIYAIIMLVVHFGLFTFDIKDTFHNMPHYLGFAIAIITYLMLANKEKNKVTQVELD